MTGRITLHLDMTGRIILSTEFIFVARRQSALEFEKPRSYAGT